MTGSINRKFLFDHVKGILFGGQFKAAQVKGIDALLESEKIKNDLFVMEHDLWNF